MDTLRRKVHIPLQMSASPLWFTTRGNANLGTGLHTIPPGNTENIYIYVWIYISHCFMSCEVYFGQKKNQPCKLCLVPSLQVIFTPLVEKIRIFHSNENKIFYGYDLQITVISRINTVSHEK